MSNTFRHPPSPAAQPERTNPTLSSALQALIHCMYSPSNRPTLQDAIGAGKRSTKSIINAGKHQPKEEIIGFDYEGKRGFSA
jgi:hypothetical protein